MNKNNKSKPVEMKESTNLKEEGIHLKYKNNKELLFSIDTASIWKRHGYITFEVESNYEPVIGEEYGTGRTMITFSWKSDINSFDDLVGVVEFHEESYDTEAEDHLSTFYFSGHYDLNEATIEISRHSEKQLAVRASGYAPDDGANYGTDSGVYISLYCIVKYDSPLLGN
jgi:hypothetical protein